MVYTSPMTICVRIHLLDWNIFSRTSIDLIHMFSYCVDQDDAIFVMLLVM